MANAYKLYKICSSCKGTGKITLPIGSSPTPTECTCFDCVGAKVYLWGYCTEAIFDIPDIPA